MTLSFLTLTISFAASSDDRTLWFDTFNKISPLRNLPSIWARLPGTTENILTWLCWVTSLIPTCWPGILAMERFIVRSTSNPVCLSTCNSSSRLIWAYFGNGSSSHKSPHSGNMKPCLVLVTLENNVIASEWVNWSIFLPWIFFTRSPSRIIDLVYWEQSGWIAWIKIPFNGVSDPPTSDKPEI